jgi:two-component system sensor kinase FixL
LAALATKCTTPTEGGDERGVIQSANAATARLFGYGVDEILGQNVKMLMPSPYREEHDGYIAAYLATGTRKIIGIGREVRGVRQDGTVFPVDLAVSEAMVEHRRLFTGVVRNLTDRKRAEAELKELQRAVEERGRLADIGAVTAQIVHDIANPIAGLSMQLQRLARIVRRSAEQSSGGATSTVIDQILAGIRRLDGLLQELRDFSRQQRLELSALDPVKLLARCATCGSPSRRHRGSNSASRFAPSRVR